MSRDSFLSLVLFVLVITAGPRYEKRTEHEAEKRNLKESTIRAYCNGTKYFLRTIGKDMQSLSMDDDEAFLSHQSRL